MTAGGDRSREGRSTGAPSDSEGLGEFASETESSRAPSAPAGAAHRIESSALISIVLALTVIGYGALVIFWSNRQSTDMRSVVQGPSVPALPPVTGMPSAAAPPPVAPAGSSPSARAVPLVEEMAAALPPQPPSAPREAVAPPPAASEAVAIPRPRTALSEEAPILAPVTPVEAAEVAAPAFEAARPAAADTIAALPFRAIEPAADPRSADREAIGGLLQSYRTSYAALDATSVSTIWQGLDTRALQRAFATLSRQDVTFDRCDVTVKGEDTAAAVCRGLLTFVPKIGDGGLQQRRLAWAFDFRRAADRWLITAVSAR